MLLYLDGALLRGSEGECNNRLGITQAWQEEIETNLLCPAGRLISLINYYLLNQES